MVEQYTVTKRVCLKTATPGLAGKFGSHQSILMMIKKLEQTEKSTILRSRIEGRTLPPRGQSSAPKIKEADRQEQGGTSLVVQWLRLQAPNSGGLGSILGGGTKIPHAVHMAREEKNKGKPQISTEPGRLQATGLQRVGHELSNKHASIDLGEGNTQLHATRSRLLSHLSRGGETRKLWRHSQSKAQSR